MITRRALGLVAALALSIGGMAHAETRWVSAWASAQQVPEDRNALPADALDDATLRQIVRVTTGGPRLRVRISNVFGTSPLKVTSARVARPLSPAGAAIDLGTDKALTFNGRPEVSVPPGAEYWSDPVALPVAPLSDLAISIHFAKAPTRQTSHPGSRATSYVAKGNQTAAADLPGATTTDHWFQLSGVDVEAEPKAAAIAVIGDSITDGYAVKPNTNLRWPDALSIRLNADPKTRGISILNLGVGGGRVLLDGLGVNAAARFDRDVLMQSGVRWMIVLEGVNDLGNLTKDGPQPPEAHAAMVTEITGAYAQMVAKARARGIKTIGATILPFGGSGYYKPDAATEADRQAINAWIRAPGNFDAVLDLDKLTRDPIKTDRLSPTFDSGDGLHPSLEGYKAMGQAVPLELFAR